MVWAGLGWCPFVSIIPPFSTGLILISYLTILIYYIVIIVIKWYMNNKGFMMTEVVVVSVIVLSVLVTMYVSYGKLFTGFKEKINYVELRKIS